MSLTDVACAIDEMIACTNQVIERVTYAAGAYVDGRWVEGATTSTVIAGVIWDAPENLLRDLPEELRREDMRLLWTREEFNEETTTVQMDHFTYDGATWNIVKIYKRREGGYTKALLGRCDVRSNPV